MIAIQLLIKNSSKWKRDSLFLFQQVGLEKLDIHIQKNETGSLSLTLYKHQFKMSQQA